jgi:hypothetical protein
MRNLLGFLALVFALLAAAAITTPALIKPMVVSAVQAASPFGDQRLDIAVDVDTLDLLRGVVGQIHVNGNHLERGGVAVAQLDLAATDVGIGDHAAAALEGSLGGVVISLEDGTTLSVDSITLTGPSTEFEAVAHFDAAQAIAFVLHAFDEQGVSVGEIQLAEGGVSFVVFEQTVTVPLVVENGALVVSDLLGGGPLEILAPQEGDPWRLTGVSVTADGLELHATVDGVGLLRSGQAAG